MPESGNIHYTLGSLRVKGTTTLNTVRLTTSSVAQGTNLSTAVTLNSPAGFITTYSQGTLLATNGSAAFSVANSFVRADSIIHANIIGYGGSGQPFSRINNVTTGSFSVVLRNVDDINAVSGDTIKIAFSVL